MRGVAYCLVLGLAAPAVAQDFTIDAHLMDRCLPLHDNPMECVGRQADACILRNGNASGDGPNMVVAACFEAEAAVWDAWLNNAYRDLVSLAREREAADLGYAADNLQIALQEMQRAWIGYRDASCGNALALAAPFGSAAGPAYHVCMTEHTARQYFILRGLRQDYVN